MILDGYIKAKRYRKLDSGDYQLESQWASSTSVFMGSGKTVEETVSPLVQDVTEIKVVSALPSDAASHPTTLYLLTK